MSKKKSVSDFIMEANAVHNCKYDYSKVEYVNNKTKVCIVCQQHGDFWQMPTDHLNGKGCPQCAGNIKFDKNKFIDKANKIHNFKYDYSKVEYVNAHTKVCIICPEHGEFWQTPNNHLNGNGCPQCKNRKISDSLRNTKDEFISKSNTLHNYKYDYSNVNYVNAHTKVHIKCPKHGEFWQTPDTHLHCGGCPKCGNTYSRPEEEIMIYLSKLSPQQHNREIMNDGKEIDIYIPSLRLGIEFNGLYWHSEALGKDKNYHLNKLNKCNKQGIRLIQIFEDEWINHREICKSKLKQICGLNHNPKIFARRCEICEIKDKNEAYKFLDANHIQGRTGFNVAIGAYYNSNLIAVMTFKKEKEGYWDLNRFATDIHYQCVGVGGKLFKHFIRNYDFAEIKSFADRRWTTDPTDNLYIKLGFDFDSFVEPTYWYYNQKVNLHKRFHKFGFRKQSLHKQYGFPLEMTEREMTESLGYTRIWDCGLIKYVYRSLVM